jgi:hypothetical protein
MDQQTHSWIAIRAIALLEQNNDMPALVSLLKPHARKASVGAWIPDDIYVKNGGCRTDCHVLKMTAYTGGQKERFVTLKPDLMKQVGPSRRMAGFLQEDASLGADWWAMPFKGDASPGQHLPNRVMALATMLKDLLLMGDEQVYDLIPHKNDYMESIDAEARTSQEAAALYFFMLSHFAADSCMPCHCDARKLSSYSGGELHHKLEKHWSGVVGNGFEKATLLKTTATDDQLFQQAKDIDAKFGLQFDPGLLPDLGKDHDEWLEDMFVCRVSFAMASVIAPYKDYPYDNSGLVAKYNALLGNSQAALLQKVDQAVLHDAVWNTAIYWKHIWNTIGD